jgi:malonate-semialdehyde dehydrogenase (acetylating) / methylmalonate-semialdehyde dehydrogenase
MIPFWYLPYAIACGNTFVVKPSERVPMTMQLVFRLIEEAGIPKGVVNLVNGAKDAVDGILDHPDIRAITFVGSTPTARYVYARAAANGKRVQAQAGAKNPVVVLPDADMEMATKIVADSAFGCAGQRCLAVSLAVTVGGAQDVFSAMISEAAASRVVGCGTDPGVEMGPVISASSKERIEELIALSAQEGGAIAVDGRQAMIKGYEGGSFVRPTIIKDPPPMGMVSKTEIFGPVLSLLRVETVEEAIRLVNSGTYGNQASLFTSSGEAARSFRNQVQAGNVGINIGVAAPMAFFPFSGWRDSFFGDLHGQGMDAVEFFTQKKIIVERWPKPWSRKF